MQDEDVKLAQLVAKYGNSWAEIARRLPGRTGALRAPRRRRCRRRRLLLACLKAVPLAGLPACPPAEPGRPS